jgi:hypothetical protein
MIEPKRTDAFRKQFARLRDERAATAIASRLDRRVFGHAGDASRWGRASASFASTMTPAIGRICRAVATKDRGHATSRPRSPRR